MLNYDLLPEHIRGSAKRYLEEGIMPGDFLQAVICNDLLGAFLKADDTNVSNMLDIVKFFYNEAPTISWGSKEEMKKWIILKRKEKEGK